MDSVSYSLSFSRIGRGNLRTECWDAPFPLRHKRVEKYFKMILHRNRTLVKLTKTIKSYTIHTYVFIFYNNIIMDYNK